MFVEGYWITDPETGTKHYQNPRLQETLCRRVVVGAIPAYVCAGKKAKEKQPHMRYAHMCHTCEKRHAEMWCGVYPAEQQAAS